MNRLGTAGLAMVVLSVTSILGWTAWSRTRSWCLVDSVPISLSRGAHFTTGEVKVNFTARYSIQILAENKISPKKLLCMLGISSHQACDGVKVLRASWKLFSDGTSAEGDSDSTIGLGGGGPGPLGATRTIGIFQCQKGRRYRLDFDVLSDTSSLNVANPRLYVGVYDTSLESNLVFSGLLRILCSIVAVIGASMVIASFWLRPR